MRATRVRAAVVGAPVVRAAVSPLVRAAVVGTTVVRAAVGPIGAATVGPVVRGGSTPSARPRVLRTAFDRRVRPAHP
ncbi:hypothetical protein GCM10022220_65670 [Actinocatenispora rupis]|uniref:Uncharacterized protein n=1 Tax=Actinocatenispora rupis TaxID=519421 RepID=A0A8J3NEG1_9ACTN|nr:hypothetical protein Aru02nite_69000 [Actinocatenispora rupis]